MVDVGLVRLLGNGRPIVLVFDIDPPDCETSCVQATIYVGPVLIVVTIGIQFLIFRFVRPLASIRLYGLPRRIEAYQVLLLACSLRCFQNSCNLNTLVREAPLGMLPFLGAYQGLTAFLSAGSLLPLLTFVLDLRYQKGGLFCVFSLLCSPPAPVLFAT